ncbi:hypothetical protein C8Q80DRAFT_678474 [Daedaleopsis nitida]|nr:hypothetical protein C8Q80DRAFT_678474 [Daedaleopsis nitida]
MNESPPTPLRLLDYDVLSQIFEELRPSKNLRPISRTCRWLYGMVAPVLYRSCYHRYGDPKTVNPRQIPRTIWSYIRSLRVLCRCPDSDQQAFLNLAQRRRRDDHVLCAPFESLPLQQALAGMPNLATLTLALHTVQYYRHGISLRTLANVLVLKQLRHLDISSISILPTPLDDQEPVLSAIAPLESFKYQLLPYRKVLSIPSETQLLDHILRSLHSTLETIWLPTEPAPLATLSFPDWPKLRELRLYGEREAMPDTPIVSLLANLTNQRVLTLNSRTRTASKAARYGLVPSVRHSHGRTSDACLSAIHLRRTPSTLTSRRRCSP